MSKKPLTLAFDLDDTLIKFTEQVCEFARELGGFSYKLSDLVTWDYPDDLDSFMKTHQYSIYATAECFACSARLVKEAHANGWKILYITARPEKSRKITEENLKVNGLDCYEKLIFTSDKAKAIRELSSEYEIISFFDDKVETINEVAATTKVPNVYLVSALDLSKYNISSRVNVIKCVCELGSTNGN